MASPRRIFRIYAQLGADAPILSEFLSAKGDPIPRTASLLIEKDAGKLLRKWGEEMHELVGVLDGSHHDPFAMEATQTYYWASLFAVVQGAAWDDLRFEESRRTAPTCGIGTLPELAAAVDRLVAQGPEGAKPDKLFLLWLVAYAIYLRQTPADQQFTLDQLMQCDLADMLKRPYLEPILRTVTE